MNDLPFAPEADGVRLAVRLTPRAKRSAIAGLVRDSEGRPALGIRIAAPPVEGAANAALVRYLAGALLLPRSAVTIRSGETSRLKIVHLAGDPATIAARLSALAGGD